jgi:hypothetical protein
VILFYQSKKKYRISKIYKNKIKVEKKNYIKTIELFDKKIVCYYIKKIYLTKIKSYLKKTRFDSNLLYIYTLLLCRSSKKLQELNSMFSYGICIKRHPHNFLVFFIIFQNASF